MTRTWAIWMEGYLATGMEGIPYRAHHVADVEAPSFAEACAMRFADDRHFNARALTYWGCGLFDNEQDARRSFG